MHISDEAVEAAVDAFYGLSARFRSAGITGDIAERCFLQQVMPAILEAASPHLIAEAWEQGWNAGPLDYNPYRSAGVGE
jgi:hypothetical protein